MDILYTCMTILVFVLYLVLTCGLLCLGLLAAEVHSSFDTFNSLLCLGPLTEILVDISTIMM